MITLALENYFNLVGFLEHGLCSSRYLNSSFIFLPLCLYIFFSCDGHFSHVLSVTERILNTRMSTFMELAFMSGECFVRDMLPASM